MRKTFFLQLLLLIVLVVILGQLTRFSQLFNLWSPHQITIEHFRAQGTQALLERHLQQVPADKREDALDALRPDFGYELSYQALETLNLTTEQRQQLQQQGHLFDPGSLNHYQSSPSVNTEQGKILVIHNMDRPSVHLQSPIQMGLKANATIVKEILKSHTQAHWPSLIDQIQSPNGIAYSLSKLSDLALTEQQKAALRQGDIIFDDQDALEQDANLAYSLIPDSSLVFVQGPVLNDTVSNNQLAALIGYYLVLGLLIALPVAVWLWPLWRFSGDIKQRCQAYAHGDFSQRLTLKQAGQLAPLAKVLNTMADKVAFSRAQSQTFSHAVSHDIRTPLTNLGFSLELYRRTNSEEKKRKILQRMRTSLDEIKRLQKELEIFSRFEHQVIDIPLQVDNLDTFWKNLTEKWHHYKEDQKNREKQKRPDSTISSTAFALNKQISFKAIHCQNSYAFNEHYLQRVLDNLISNALRHADSQIIVTLDETEHHGHIKVENNGQPIDQQDWQRIFDPFIRLEESRNRDSGGAGLGLSIVKAIVEAHNGNIQVSDSPLGGACFEITLPCG